MRKFAIVLNLLLLTLFLSSCVSTTAPGAVGINRKQFFIISSAEMEQGAKMYYAKTLTDAKNKGELNVNAKEYRRVQEIANRLIAQSHIFKKEALNWDWEINVIDEDILNAWCMPGGKIAIYTGIIRRLNLSDAEIAAIIGHEMAHALREHGRERASSQQLKEVGLYAISMATGDDLITGLSNMAAEYTIMLPFSRSHETEADIIGTELMARAGYNPNAAINVWKKMQNIGSSSTIEFLSTHPSHESRIKTLEEISQKVMPLYIQATQK